VGPEAVGGVVGTAIAGLCKGIVVFNGEVVLTNHRGAVLLAFTGACVVTVIYKNNGYLVHVVSDMSLYVTPYNLFSLPISE
jgi:hypothetical protein